MADVHPGGRPSKYKPEYCKHLVDYFKTGYIEDNTLVPYLHNWAERIGISKKTLFNWKDKHEEFLHAYEKAKDIFCQKIVDGGLSSEFNSGFAKFVAINFTDMKDKVEQEVNGQQTLIIQKAETLEKEKE